MKKKPARPGTIPSKGKKTTGTVRKTPPKTAPDLSADDAFLKMVDLGGAEKGSNDPAQSAATVAGLNQILSQAKTGTDKDQYEEIEERTKLPDVEQPKLTDGQIQQLSEMQSLLQMSETLDIAETAKNIYDRHRKMERMRQIEDALEPINLEDFLFHETVTQDIPITENYVLTYQTIPSELEIDIAEVVEEYLEQFGKVKNKPINRNWVLRIGTLVCGLRTFNGQPMPGAGIVSMALAEKEKEQLRKEIRIHLRKFLKKPTEMLVHWADHQEAFIIRTRNVLNHAGYTDNVAGKSSETPSSSQS